MKIKYFTNYLICIIPVLLNNPNLQAQTYNNYSLQFKNNSEKLFELTEQLLENSFNQKNKLTNTTFIDSMVSARYDTTAEEVKTIYTYNEQNKLSNVKIEYFDENEIQSGESYSFTYNKGKLGNILSYQFDDQNWIPNERTNNDFDPNGNNILTTKEKWDISTSVWIGINRVSRTFDSQKNMLTEMTEIWDSASTTWKKFTIVENTYNNKQKISSVLKIRTGEIWFNFTKSTYAYGSNNNLSEEKSFLWNYTDNVWNEIAIETHTYNQNNLEISLLRKEWSDNNWVNKKRVTNTYISDLLLNHNLVEVWENGSWLKYSDMTITYNTDAQITSYSAMKKWNGNNWDEGDKLFFEYNSDDMCENINHESWFQNHWVSADGLMWPPNLLTYNPEFMLYYFTTGYEAELFYPNATAIENNSNSIPNKITLSQNYPNPFNPTTTIEYSIPFVKTLHATSQHVQLKIYDILGKEVATLVNKKQTAGNYKITFDASRLTSGIYYYKITAGEFTQVRKMILVK